MKKLNELGRLIKAARRERGMSQLELSKAVGYPSTNMVTGWENGLKRLYRKDWDACIGVLGDALDQKAAAEFLEAELFPEESRVVAKPKEARIDKEINQRLRGLRLREGYSSSFVAEQLEMTIAQYSRIEHDMGNPTLGQLRKLGKLYGVSYDYLLDGAGSSEDISKVIEERNQLRQLLKILKLPNLGETLTRLETELQEG